MNTKRLFALLAALLMIVALFSACSNNEAKDDKKGDVNANTGDSANTPDDGNDAPDEGEALVTISWMGRGTTDNLRLAQEGNYANLNKVHEIAAQYGFEVDSTQAEVSVYVNTINSLAAAGQLPDAYISYGMIDNNTIVSWIEAGRFVSCSEMMEYSTGNMAKFFADDGQLRFAKAAATYTDNDWYFVFMTNDTARSVKIEEADGPLRAVVQIHGTYSVMTRQDWLDKLSLSMPQTTEEYYEACLAMQKNDVNGNGQADERIVMGLGTEYQYQGVGQWFGLPYIDFIEDPSSGEVEVGILKEGFADWASYLGRFYAENLIYNNEGGQPWNNTATFIAENNVISWTLTPNNLWKNGRDNSGDDNCNYQPMPIIAAVDGVAARVMAQEAAAAEFAVSFNADTIAAKDAVKLIDFAYSYELYLLYYFGIEGMAWEYTEDGKTIDNFTQHEGYKKGDIENQYMPLQGMDSTFAGMVGYTPNPKDQDLWAANAHVYSSYGEALEAGEPYAQDDQDEARWMNLNDWNESSPLTKYLRQIAEYGEENINWAAYYTFVTLPTIEEAEVQAEYANDLKTYLQETAAKLITAEYEIANLQNYIDYAYENLGLQQYIDAQQARVDRFMDAMGL